MLNGRMPLLIYGARQIGKYSFPVGKVQMLTMYQMDLEEVLWCKRQSNRADRNPLRLDCAIQFSRENENSHHYCE